jgi:hypothetical protein
MGQMVLLSLPKKDVLWIFITLKNPLPLARFEPVNHGSNCKYANHYTTEDNEQKGRKIRTVKQDLISVARGELVTGYLQI